MIHFTEQEIDKIIKLYETMSLNQISKHYGLSKDVFKRIFRDNNIPIKSFTEVRSLVKNNPFKNLNDPEVQYWLGWLATDGNISRYSIKLALTDLSVIEQFAKFCGLTHINTYQPKSANEKKQYRVQFSNKTIAEFLIELGITRNKSHTLDLKIPISWQLLLGIIEGDGWIYKSKNGNRRSIGICSISTKFIDQISLFYNKEKIKYIIQKKDQGTTPLYKIIVNGKKDIETFQQKLYNVNFPVLERKKQKLYN